MKKIIVSNIEWDTDGERVNLPTKVIIRRPSPELLEDAENGGYDDLVCDYLSDRFGWCICGFAVDVVDYPDTEEIDEATA